MRPYKHIRLEEWPDMGDIRAEGRKSCCSHLPGKNGECRSHARNSASKKATRRSLKRADKAKDARDAKSYLD